MASLLCRVGWRAWLCHGLGKCGDGWLRRRAQEVGHTPSRCRPPRVLQRSGGRARRRVGWGVGWQGERCGGVGGGIDPATTLWAAQCVRAERRPLWWLALRSPRRSQPRRPVTPSDAEAYPHRSTTIAALPSLPITLGISRGKQAAEAEGHLEPLMQCHQRSHITHFGAALSGHFTRGDACPGASAVKPATPSLHDESCRSTRHHRSTAHGCSTILLIPRRAATPASPRRASRRCVVRRLRRAWCG